MAQGESSAQAQVRAELSAERVRRGTWIRIAGPIAAVVLGVGIALFYLRPIETLRFIQLTRIGWSGVAQDEIALNDGLMTYLVTGGYPDQEPLVLIHGLGPNAALVWRDVAAPLAEAHYKVIAPNLMGFASSEHRQVTYTIAYQAGVIAQFIDALKIDHVNVIGHDLGADVALYYAIEHPDKVERLILVSGGLIGPRGAQALRKAMLPTDDESMRAQAESMMFGLPPLPDFMYDRMMVALAADLPAQTDMLNSVPADEAKIRSGLDKIFNTLVVILSGGRDPVFTPAQADALHAALPGSATVTFKTSGHFPQLEHPDDFSESVEYLLKQKEGGY